MPKGIKGFQKGHKPMGGRKKATHTIESEAAKQYLVQEVVKELEAILRPQIEKAKAGDSLAFKNLLDRAFGRPKESLDVNKVTLIMDE